MVYLIARLKARPSSNFKGVLCGLAASLLFVGCSGTSTPAPATVTPTPAPAPAPTVASQWVVGWGASPENALSSTSNPGGSEQSFRSFFYPTVGGTQERVRFSNLYGTAPITVGAARLALAAASNGLTGNAIDPTQDTALTFAGSPSVTVAAGQEVVSDPVKLTYALGQELAVSFYLKGSFSPLVHHTSEFNTNFESAAGAGDATADATGASFSQAVSEWLVATGVDVYGPYAGTVALFGSSSVDGHGSNYGNTAAYPAANTALPGQTNDRPSDWLGRQLAAAGINMGVLNAGALGDPAGEDAHSGPGQTQAGVDRMQHDVLAQPGIKAVVIYFGGIDLRSDCKPATDVEASLTAMVAQAKAAGVRVVLATLPPAEYCTSQAPLPTATDPYGGDLNPGPENTGSTQRRALNTWIRSAGAALPGVVGIADFDQALADPAHPDFLQPTLNSSDNFHPNGEGYRIQSAAIPLSVLPGS